MYMRKKEWSRDETGRRIMADTREQLGDETETQVAAGRSKDVLQWIENVVRRVPDSNELTHRYIALQQLHTGF
jgi:ABC-type xylose transport system substrate-binding protein